MLTFNEHAGFEFRAEFEDSAHRATYPTTAHWKLYDVTNGQTLQDWTAASVAQETDSDGSVHYYIDAEVPGTLHVIQTTGRRREQTRLIVVADKDLGGEFSEEFGYYVRKVPGR